MIPITKNKILVCPKCGKRVFTLPDGGYKWVCAHEKEDIDKKPIENMPRKLFIPDENKNTQLI